MTTQNIPGDVIIKTISLFSDKGTVNMLEHVKGISIYESIFTPGVMVELSIWDTQNMSSELPILAGQRISIEIQTPGRKSMKYDAVISKLRDGIPAENYRTKSYVIMATSPEVLRNASNQVTKSYNTNISSMISDIVKTYLGTKKKVNIQDTRGVQKVLIQNQNPFDAIAMLRKRSVSSSDKSSSYVFFENQDGLNFKTLENLMSADVGDRIFTNDDTIRSDISKPMFRNIICYEQPQQMDAQKRIKLGGLQNNVRKFDFKTLEYKVTQSKFNASDFKNPDGTMKNPDASEMQQYGKSSAINRWVMHDSSKPDTFLADNLGKKVNALSIFGDSRLLLEVFGDSELTAGRVIEVKNLENATTTNVPKEHHLLSGNYLITFIRHIIGPEGNNPRYTCSVEAIKGGYKEAV
jgi:hypothetical protein